MIEYLKFVTASAFLFIGQRRCIHDFFVFYYKEQQFFLFYDLVLNKLIRRGLNTKDYVIQTQMYTHYLLTSVFYQGRNG